MPEIFVNYRTRDGQDVATVIERELSRRFGDDAVFRASKSIRPGDNFRAALSAASGSAQVLLVIIGSDWLTMCDEHGRNRLDDEHDWTRKEILNAFEAGARVIPILCGRLTDRLSPAALPPALAELADCQSLRFDSGNANADLDKLVHELVDLVPGLVDGTRQPDPTPSSTHNSIHGNVSGLSIQAGSFTQSGGSIGRTVIHNSEGPVHSGDGPQYNGPQYNGTTFHGDGNNYVAGGNDGGIRQRFGRKNERETDR